MSLVFIDIATDHGPRALHSRPVGGTQSALLHLAQTPMIPGAPVHIFNQTRAPRAEDGLTLHPLENLETALPPDTKAVIICGRWTGWLIEGLRAHTRAPLILWHHEALLDQEWTPLSARPDAVVCVSRWQQQVNMGKLSPGLRHAVIGNAISQAVRDHAPPEILAKKNPGTCVYMGASARGLANLVALWPVIHAGAPQASLEIFCDPVLAPDAAQNARALEKLHALPNLRHVGALPLPALAPRLARAQVMLAPNPYPETSCIALMECMALGLGCVVSARAALPETAHGFAHLVPCANPDDPHTPDNALDADKFIAAAHAALQTPPAARAAQVEFARAEYNWVARAQTWREFLSTL